MARVPAIDVSQLRQRLKADPAPFLLDVREPWEYQEGHVPGAQLIPLGELEQRVNEVPRDRPVLAICHSGQRSLAALLIRRPAATGPSDAVLGALTDLGALKSNLEAVSNQQSALSQSLGMVQTAVQGVETKVLESSAGVRDAIGKDLSEARIAMERLKVDAQERRRMEEDVQASARRIETVLLGSRTRGAAGENILQDAFRQFPAEMIDMNFRVNGKVVEYALILENARRLPT